MTFALDATEDVIEKNCPNAFVQAMKETISIVNNFLNMMPFTLEIEDVEKFLATVKKVKEFDEFFDQKDVPVVQP